MVSRSLFAALGILSLSLFSHTAMALDQLPLPHVEGSSINVEIKEFASEGAYPVPANACVHLLKTENKDEKIRAIKAYRECRSHEALQQLAVWRWQEASNY